MVDEIIRLSNSSTSLLDPAPTSLLKNCLAALSLPITHFINTSMSSGTVPSKLKIAAVTPVLKKHGLEPSSLSSYRPISNLSFLSKILEKVVASQLQAFLTAHNLYEPFQSGFRPLHSTETALVKVINDLLLASDSGALSTLLLLDLSSAFDTVCHEILLSRLSAIGITGTALEWFSTYLTGKQQFVIYQNHRSSVLVYLRVLFWALSSLPFICYQLDKLSSIMGLTSTATQMTFRFILAHLSLQCFLRLH